MANPWTKLRRLLPHDPLLVGTVTAIDQAGNSTVALLGGGTVRVRGQGVAIGAKAYVQGGEIQGEAPDLEEVAIDV